MEKIHFYPKLVQIGVNMDLFIKESLKMDMLGIGSSDNSALIDTALPTNLTFADMERLWKISVSESSQEVLGQMLTDIWQEANVLLVAVDAVRKNSHE